MGVLAKPSCASSMNERAFWLVLHTEEQRQCFSSERNNLGSCTTRNHSAGQLPARSRSGAKKFGMIGRILKSVLLADNKRATIGCIQKSVFLAAHKRAIAEVEAIEKNRPSAS